MSAYAASDASQADSQNFIDSFELNPYLTGGEYTNTRYIERGDGTIVPETGDFLKFIYNCAVVQSSSNLDELLEAIELASKYGILGIDIYSKSAVFFKDNANYHGSNGFFLFKQGMTTKDIIAVAANPPAPGTFVV